MAKNIIIEEQMLVEEYYVQMNDGKTSYKISYDDYEEIKKLLVDSGSQKVFETQEMLSGNPLTDKSFLNTRTIVISAIISVTKQRPVRMPEKALLSFEEVQKLIDTILEKEDEYTSWDYEFIGNKLKLTITDDLFSIYVEEVLFSQGEATKEYINASVNHALEKIGAHRERNTIEI